MTTWPESRLVGGRLDTSIRIEVTSRATYYAARWLDMLGLDCAQPTDGVNPLHVTVVSGTHDGPETQDVGDASCVIRLWDFQVGYSGPGFLASAVSGAATVIGFPGRPAVALPADIPEKWCGAYGAILALAETWRRRQGMAITPVAYDVSAADVLRVFALQNAGSHEEMVKLWRRNGRIPVEHGGIFPMGFFACQDGYVALLGRSRRDWANLRQALGNPAWAESEAFADPFKLARDSAKADQLLVETLQEFTRDELLERGLSCDAVIAPVFSHAEAAARDIFRPDFATPAGPAMPFLVGKRSTSNRGNANHALPPRPEAAGRSSAAHDLPLAGLRCIELCWVWSGPLVGQTLADLGAEVIKVESRRRFDLYRTRGLESRRGEMPEHVRLESSLYFHSLNRNKVGMTVDLKDERGLDVIKHLMTRSDLLLDNFTVGTLDRLGLTEAVMRAANPDLVVLSMSGPGRDSALRHLRSYGLVLSALAGAEHLIEADGEFIGSPTYSISDPNAALFATLGALAGVLGSTGGGGIRIDVSQIEAAATLVGTHGPGPREDQNAIVGADDGTEIALSLPPGIECDPKALLYELNGRSKAEIFARCRALNIQSAEVLLLEETDNAPIFSACSGWLASSHPFTGSERIVAAPWRLDGRRPVLRKTAPLLGEGNDYVLRRILGLPDEEIEQLVTDGVV